MGIGHPRFSLSSITCATEACLVAARARLRTKCLCLFFSSFTSAIQTCLVAARVRLWTRCLYFFFSSITGAIQTYLVAVRAKLKDLSSLCIPFLFFFLISI